MKEDGHLVGKIVSQAGKPMEEEILADDEQIIGVFGEYDKFDIKSLGMIVWRPYQI